MGGEKAVVLPVSTVLSSDSQPIDVGSTPPLTGEGEPPLVATKRTVVVINEQVCITFR